MKQAYRDYMREYMRRYRAGLRSKRAPKVDSLIAPGPWPNQPTKLLARPDLASETLAWTGTVRTTNCGSIALPRDIERALAPTRASDIQHHGYGPRLRRDGFRDYTRWIRRLEASA